MTRPQSDIQRTDSPGLPARGRLPLMLPAGLMSAAGLLLAAWGLLAAGCGGPSSPSFPTPAGTLSSDASPDRVDRPLRVLVTVAMVGDLVREVGGERVRVTQLMGSGVDPHLYKVTRDDVREIFAADTIFYGGLMLEGKMTHVLHQMARRKPVIAVSESLLAGDLRDGVTDASAGGSTHADPHLWMDVELWAEALEPITAALADLLPEYRDEFELNAARYREQLAALHRYGVEVIGLIPAEQRILVTSHDAFGYFGRAYGLRVLGVQGVSTSSEAGLLRINRLVDLIVSRKVPAVFVETSVSEKSMRAVIDGAAARGHRPAIGGELYSDAAGPAGAYEGTYIGMMDHNFTTISRSLGGSPPAGGFRGRSATQFDRRADAR